MNNSNDERDRCAVCGKDVTDASFARLRRGNEWVKVCSPACSIRYTDGPRPAEENRAQEFDASEHRLYLVVNGEF